MKSDQISEVSAQPENATECSVKTCNSSDYDFTFTLYDVYNVHYRLGGTIEVYESGIWNHHQPSGKCYHLVSPTQYH